jgi:hypothetical protein
MTQSFNYIPKKQRTKQQRIDLTWESPSIEPANIIEEKWLLKDPPTQQNKKKKT